MDLLYSGSLLVAFVAGAVGVLLALLVLLKRARLAWIRAAYGAVALGTLSLVISITVHRRWGHGSASAEPMDVTRFLSAHLAFLVAALIIVVALAVIAYTQKKRAA